MHPYLLLLSAKLGRPVTDPWCSELAALHLRYMIETGEDMDKVLVTPSLEELERYAPAADPAPAARRGTGASPRNR
jgi:hypothetical protein